MKGPLEEAREICQATQLLFGSVSALLAGFKEGVGLEDLRGPLQLCDSIFVSLPPKSSWVFFPLSSPLDITI